MKMKIINVLTARYARLVSALSNPLANTLSVLLTLYIPDTSYDGFLQFLLNYQ